MSGRIDTGIGAPARGAGRMVDVIVPNWIGWSGLANNGSCRSLQGINKNIGANPGNIANVATASFIPVATRACMQLRSVAAGNYLEYFWTSFMAFHPALTQDCGDLSLYDDFAVTRVFAIAKIPAGGDFLGDCGLQVLQANATLDSFMGAKLQSRAGFAFQNVGANHIQLQVRQTPGGAVTKTVEVANGGTFDQTIFHAYELRFLNATPNSSAKVKILLDGALISTLDYATDPLPTTNGTGAQGFVTAFGVSSVATAQFGQIRFQQAPDEASVTA